MGQGGFLTLINKTNSDWNLTSIHSYQMENWKFPAIIRAGTSERVYVEWMQRPFKNQKDDAGNAVYQLKDGSTFNVEARAGNGFILNIELRNLVAIGNPLGSILPLGWLHNGNIDFEISGKSGSYRTSEPDTANWMRDNLPLLGNVALKNMCIAGTHDAGMSVRTSGTAFGRDCNTLTQTRSIAGQLELGSRYFDIRPVISAGQYYTGHYGKIDALNSWQGANGQSIAQIIKEVNDFTAKHHELVILNLSHSLNTDLGNTSYRAFNASEWVGLLKALQGINYLYDGTNADFTQLTLNHFIKNGPRVLVIVEDSPLSALELKNYKFYPYSNFNVYNDYANSNDVVKMADDQIAKMQRERPVKYFLLSWTLTQDSGQAVTCSSSILDLARKANAQLTSFLYPKVSREKYPNIIFVDDLSSKQVVKVALAINDLVQG